MKDEIVNWGIIATGKIAHSFAKAVNYVDDAKLLAVASRELRSAMEFADTYGIPRSYQGYNEICKDSDIDIIYIATPMSCHYENVKMCLENGKNVLCEKSVTMNYEELEELVSLAKEKNCFFMEAMWMKCLPAFLKALKWVRDGKIGNIKMIKADFSNIVRFNENDRLLKKDLGGGALLDLGVYPINLFTAFLGNYPDEIQSNLFIGRTGVDFDGQITLKYGDAFATGVIGFDIENHNNAVIVGDKGRVVFGDWFFCTSDVKLYNDMAELVEEKNFPHLCNGYEYEIFEANRCLKEGKKQSDLVPLEDTIANMRIMDFIMSKHKIYDL